VQQSVDHTIMVTLDAEHWSTNSLRMTELGICTISRQDLVPLVQDNNYGDHGDIMMRAAEYHFFRLLEKTICARPTPTLEALRAIALARRGALHHLQRHALGAARHL
jgi:hypothetical protein